MIKYNGLRHQTCLTRLYQYGLIIIRYEGRGRGRTILLDWFRWSLQRTPVTIQLHPNEALTFSQDVGSHLQSFADGFKERIEIEIEYSKALFRISKRLSKYVRPSQPSPLSYLSSAFEVEHEQRARHALELAEYLHS